MRSFPSPSCEGAGCGSSVVTERHSAQFGWHLNQMQELSPASNWILMSKHCLADHFFHNMILINWLQSFSVILGGKTHQSTLWSSFSVPEIWAVWPLAAAYISIGKIEVCMFLSHSKAPGFVPISCYWQWVGEAGRENQAVYQIPIDDYHQRKEPVHGYALEILDQFCNTHWSRLRLWGNKIITDPVSRSLWQKTLSPWKQ